MPMTRYQVRNEYSLADPELYKAADKDDPEALLEGVAMAGLVGVLRQLGDLAEFAAEIFHDLHEEVMVTAARGHTLMSRVQQLESEFPPIEKAFLSQTSHSTFFSNSGTEWHPNLQTNQNLITKGDLPRFVMDSYEEARGPPRLFLLDKFDIAGAGSCLKRYTDPSFYKVEASFLEMASVDVQRDKKFRKAKKKGPRWMHGGTPEILPSIKLHQLFLEERVESGASDPARLVKLKRKSSASSFGSENGKSYMEKFLKTPPEDEMVHEVFVGSSPLKLPSKSTTGSGHEIQILDVSNVGSDAEPIQRIRGPYPPPSLGRTIVSPSENDFFEDIVEEKTSVGPTSNHSFDDKDVVVDGEIKAAERESNHSDYDDASEIDSYMDALATMESEVETDTEFRPKKGDDVGFLDTEKHRMDSNPNDEHLLSQSQSQFSDSQSIGNFTASDDGNSSIRKGVSSFSCSDDTASTSAEDTPSPSNQDSIIDKVGADQLPEHEASDNGKNSDKSGELELSDASSDASEILSDPTKTEEQQTDDKSEISCGPTETEELAAEESGEISSGLTEINAQPTDDNGKISGGLTKMEEQLANVDDMLERRDEITPRLSYEEHLEDEAEIEDSYVDSCTVIDKANIFEEIHEKDGSENSLEDVIQTNFVENVSARNSVDSQVMSPDSVISHPEEQPSVLHLEGLAGNPNDDLSDKFDSAEIALDGTRDGKLSRDSESDVEEGEIETHMNPMASEFLSHVSEYQDRPSLSDNHSQSDGRGDKIVHAEDEVECGCKSSLPEDPAGGSEFTSQLESIDYPDHMNHKTGINTDFDSSELTIPTQPLEQEKELHIEELDVGPLLVGKVTRESSQLDLVESNETDRESLPGPTLGEASVFELPQTSNHTFDFSQKVNAPLNQASDFPGFNTDFDSSELTIPTQPLEQEKELHVEELDVGPLLVGKVTRESSQLDLVESNETDRESLPGPTLGEALVFELPQTSNHTFDFSQKVNAPLNQASDFPGFNLLPEVAQLNLEEMPPLPPLPPMQWRIGKFQHASVPSGGDDGQQVDHFPHIFPSIRNENVQASNPFLLLPPMNVEDSRHEDLMGDMVNSTPFLLQMPIPNLVESWDDFVDLKETQSLNPFGAVSETNCESPQHARGGVVIQPTVDHVGSCNDHLTLGQSQSSNHLEAGSAPSDEKSQHAEEGEMIQPTVDEQLQHAGEEEMIQPSDNSFPPGITPGPTPTCSSETPNGESTESPHQLSTEASLRKEEQDHSSLVSEMIVVGPTEDFVPHPPVEICLPGQPEHVEPATEEETVCSTSTSGLPSVDDEKPNALPSVDNEKSNGNQIPKFPRPQSPLIDAVAAQETVCSTSTSGLPSVDDEKPNALPSVDNEKSNGNQIPKFPRPRSPLIDAVAAHDKSKLRKVTERVRPQEQKVEEKDSILEQIRMKSFNLKPAVATRPTIHGPRTNLRVAAILEKANAIRQAFAGSDDDDDDSWSDS